MFPDSDAIVNTFAKRTQAWFSSLPKGYDAGEEDAGLMHIMTGVHYCNFLQWNKENAVRAATSSDIVAQLKREIDLSNSERNLLIMRVDEYFVSKLKMKKSRDWSELYIDSQTLGQIVDRLSVLSLRRYFMEMKTREARSEASDARVRHLDIISEQIRYVGTCYDRFLEKLRAGEGYMMPHEQFKMYGDEDGSPDRRKQLLPPG